MWRLAVARRERAMQWVSALAERKELTCDPRTRFECFAELLVILAEHAGASDQARASLPLFSSSLTTRL
jgi:hypothetical protein